MPAEPVWLTEEELIHLNAAVVAASPVGPEPHGILEEGRVSNAVAAPQQSFHYGGTEDLVALAVRFLEAIARGHLFLQGNKRTAFYAAGLFLERNGAILIQPDTEEAAEQVVDLIERKIDAERLSAWLRPYVLVPPRN